VSAEETIIGYESADAVDEREDLDDESLRKRRRAELAALLGLAVILAAIIWWILTYTVIVPPVVGLDTGEATIRLTATDLKVGKLATVRSSRYGLGEIAQQMPPTGRRVLRGSSVDLGVARQLNTSPRVGSAGALEQTETFSTTAWSAWEPRDTSQPEPRTYSTQYPGHIVPMVEALSEKKARKKLESAGYKVKVKYGATSSGPGPGKVFFQYPAPYASEERGTRIEIWVSTGGPPTGRTAPVPREWD
jgi:hypothetical protein